jgi:rubrerythrin
MPESQTLDIIKGAILLEHKGKALYDSVRETSEIDAVKELFTLLSQEEDTHIKILNRQFRRLTEGKGIEPEGLEESHSAVADTVISESITKEVYAAGYEAAVISAALEFEKQAVKYYSEHAASAVSQGEKEIFGWLTAWEKSHMQMLAKLDDELKEKIWFDNQFWPMD